jgi:hypothetical protein
VITAHLVIAHNSKGENGDSAPKTAPTVLSAAGDPVVVLPRHERSVLLAKTFPQLKELATERSIDVPKNADKETLVPALLTKREPVTA